MNIVFIGTSEFAVPALEKLLASPHRVMAVVTQPDRPSGRGREMHPSPVKEVAVARSLYLFQPQNVNEYEFLRELRALSPDVIVVVAYGQKLSNEILDMPRFYCLNIHPSLLPRHRGPSPIQRTILNGDSQAGVCVVKVVEKMDAGPVLGVTTLPVPPEITTEDLEKKLAQAGADLLLETLEAVQQGTAVELPQNEREATYAKKLEKNDGRIDWRKQGFKIHNFVRALQPYPLAFGFLNRARINIYRVSPQRGQRPVARFGSIVAIEKDALRVACGDGTVLIHELQPENKRRMTAAEFINGYKPKVGDLFA